ncbi:hypothetical protein SAMN05421858_0052 [Haladaptatus litoreus]|uniref:Peptidase family M23 n=1 Tax=Haladaptatus litoreus TaxID=553468 RepID=A0A1N6URK2_9EURY|nr:hypothetical protein [Haladaptatus litoreus]SIQ67876.1 hypothetical protein SAMN05421858_0052 [Haladaptatus litoreus]
MVGLSPEVLSHYPRFSLYNSPYTAHDEGCAIDLYPGSGDFRASDSRAGSEATRETSAPSPVAGEVVETRTVTAPQKPYAVAHDYLIVVDTGDYLARMLHVEPSVEPGDWVEVGDSLGAMVRSGFFAPWVANHIHLGFRPRDSNPVRASGSLPMECSVEIEPLAWDGSGRVVATGDTFVVLDSPTHPAPGERFAGIAAIAGDETIVLDGGLPHYEGGGALAQRFSDISASVSLLGSSVGRADGRTVTWNDVEIRANGTPITGLSLFVAREQFGAKLVCPGHDFSVGDSISVSIR